MGQKNTNKNKKKPTKETKSDKKVEKQNKPKKTLFQTYLSNTEAEKWRERAELSKMPLTEFVRKVVRREITEGVTEEVEKLQKENERLRKENEKIPELKEKIETIIMANADLIKNRPKKEWSYEKYLLETYPDKDVREIQKYYEGLEAENQQEIFEDQWLKLNPNQVKAVLRLIYRKGQNPVDALIQVSNGFNDDFYNYFKDSILKIKGSKR